MAGQDGKDTDPCSATVLGEDLGTSLQSGKTRVFTDHQKQKLQIPYSKNVLQKNWLRILKKRCIP